MDSDRIRAKLSTYNQHVMTDDPVPTVGAIKSH
ncbi:MAG: hypothetical protein ACI83E_002707 [Sulfitobacter sp.]